MTTIQSIVDQFATQINDPSSDTYLPKLILASSDPSFDPLQLKDVNIGDIDLDIPRIGDVEVEFTSLNVVGLANLTIRPETIRVNGNRIAATVDVSKLDSRPPLRLAETVHMVGDIKAVSETGKKLNGTLDLKIEEAEIKVEGEITLGDEPTVVIEKIEFIADISQSNIDTTIKLDSGRLLSRIVDKFFDVPRVRRMIIDSINDEISSSLGRLSRLATQAVRQSMG